MVHRWVSTAWSNTGVENKDAVDQEAGNIASYMDSNTSGDFSDYSFGHVSIGWTSGERDFIETMLEAIHNNDDYAGLAEHETVLIPHDNWSWGYGRLITYEVEPEYWVQGATVYAGTEIPRVEARIMSWHEAGHAWTYDSGRTGGEHAQASVNCCNSSNQMYNITPMTASYARDEYGYAYMTYGGDATEPETYCNGVSNYKGMSCWGCYTDVFDYSRFSTCVLEDAETWLDNTS